MYHCRDFKEYHTDTTVKFVVKVTGGRDGMRKLEHEGLHKVFKLQTVINTSSMVSPLPSPPFLLPLFISFSLEVLFDANNCLRKFTSPEEICREFYKTRKVKYEERKRFLEGMLKAQSDRLSNQVREIEWMNGMNHLSLLGSFHSCEDQGRNCNGE